MWIKRSKLEKLEEEKLQLKKELANERANNRKFNEQLLTQTNLIQGYELLLLKVKEVHGIDNLTLTMDEIRNGVNFSYEETFNHKDNTFKVKWGGIHDVKK